MKQRGQVRTGKDGTPRARRTREGVPTEAGAANQAPAIDEGAAAQAARELSRLQEQTAQAREELTGVQRDLAEARNSLVDTQAQLLEANEMLGLAKLRARPAGGTGSPKPSNVQRLGEFDALTGLPNLVLLFDRCERAIALAERHGSHLALLFLDLSDFKQVNDTLGQAVGDQVLRRVAHGLSSSVREADTVSRYGSDEFLILLTDMADATHASLVADKMLAALALPTRVESHVLRLNASIGISIYPQDGGDVASLVDRAGTAMSRAKQRGRGSIVFHGEDAAGDRNLSTAALTAFRRPLTRFDTAPSEHERKHAELREANEQLVLAALSARHAVAAADAAQPQHMARLASDLLDVSRVNPGRLRTVEMAKVIDEAIDTCRPAMDMRLQHFRVHMPSRALEVQGDPVRLAQIFSNLLNNASKYTPNEGEIKLSVEVVGETIVTTVSDSGIGIIAEALPTVFDRFVPDPQAIGFNGLGSGIGLTVVRELVAAHGGAVLATSAGNGLGSQFVVTLPVVKRPANG